MARLPGPLFLIGYRGAGKTSVARRLAQRLGWDWVDADDEIERQAGKSIRDIFADQGEAAFRDLESEIVQRLARRRQLVVALGGGAILREPNRQALRQQGWTVWLQASPQTIWQRLQADHTSSTRRPNLTAAGGYAEVCQLMQTREPIYRACADWSIATEDHTPDAIADAIFEWLQTSDGPSATEDKS